MENRSEDDKVTQAELKVTLGSKEYGIAPLVIKYSREWRKKSMPLIAFLINYSRGSQEDMEDAVTELFGQKTDEIVESFFEYAKDLPREEIEENATEGEIIKAFMEVFNAFVSPLSEAALKAETPETSPKKTAKSSQ